MNIYVVIGFVNAGGEGPVFERVESIVVSNGTTRDETIADGWAEAQRVIAERLNGAVRYVYFGIGEPEEELGKDLLP